MLGFNTILRDAGIDPAVVKLVRHQDRRAKRGRTPFELWCARDGRLEAYQAVQAKERFAGMRYVASFVATPTNETLFIGLYEVNGIAIAPEGMMDPVVDEDVGGLFLYDLGKSERLSLYDGRIVIDWGKSFINWAQNAKGQDKPVLEIKRQVGEPPFPGLISFVTTIGGLAAIPASWRLPLSAVKGVYLLVCLRTGKQYVGAAYGIGGFWERWEQYRQNGHGGNEDMKLDPHTEYQVSVLETAASSALPADIIALESRWKEKLRSRQFGLNSKEGGPKQYSELPPNPDKFMATGMILLTPEEQAELG